MSVARLCRMPPACRTRSYSSTCQSCDSICVVSDVEADAEPLDERARQLGPVDVGFGGEVRRPGAGRAGELGEILGRLDLRRDALEPPDEDGELLAHRRRRRGLAVRADEHRRIPVLDRRGRASAAMTARSFGSQTAVTARWTVSAYDAELMSSLVHAKCVSSAIASSPSADRRSRTRYSTAFTSCRVTASFSASQSISVCPKSRYSARRSCLCRRPTAGRSRTANGR